MANKQPLIFTPAYLRFPAIRAAEKTSSALYTGISPPLAKVLQVLVSIILQAFSPCPAG